MRRSFFNALLLGAALSGLTPLRADHTEILYDANGRPAGHSLHGEAFDEGPRQSAALMEGMPTIDFPVTTSSAEAQKFFNQGVGQLHGFWYFEAERSFRQVRLLDTNCVMAYWGMAMANVNNEKRAREFIKSAVELTKDLPRREKLYIDSLAKFYDIKPGDDKKSDAKSNSQRDDRARHLDYIKSLEQIIEEFPKDLEAKAFLAFKIWENNGRNRNTSSTATDALAREVIAASPMHPVHHLRIHLWNNDADRRAIESAALCGQGSPGIAHMWHMPGHTYSALKRYQDATWQQEASARVDHAYMIANRVLPDQIHNYAHNNDWLVQSFSHVGRVAEALDLARNLIELPRHPKYNNLGKVATREDLIKAAEAVSGTTAPRREGMNKSASMGRRRLIEVLNRWELWDEAITLGSMMYLERTEVPVEQSQRARMLATAHYRRGNVEAGDVELAEFEAAMQRQRELRQLDVEIAEAKTRRDKKSDEDINKAMTDAMQQHTRVLTGMQNALTELKIYKAIAKKEPEAARDLLIEAKDIQKERLAQLRLEIGDKEQAEKLAAEAVKAGTNEVQRLANYVDILARIGKTDDAKKQLEELRRVAASADLNTPVMKRVTEFATTVGLSADWRNRYEPATDVGIRPDLDQLGPLRWRPATAPEWTLRDSKNRKVSLDDYRGKPVLMVFYLGYGCSHCLEQLNAFAPKVNAFKEAGISVVAVSVDSVEGLEKTFEKSKTGDGFEFPILSDKSLETFKKYHAHDDFESSPLHGAFLVDAEGLIRWQDISYEPFTDVDFLLNESKRLLNLPVTMKMAKAQKTRILSPRAKEQLTR